MWNQLCMFFSFKYLIGCFKVSKNLYSLRMWPNESELAQPAPSIFKIFKNCGIALPILFHCVPLQLKHYIYLLWKSYNPLAQDVLDSFAGSLLRIMQDPVCKLTTLNCSSNVFTKILCALLKLMTEFVLKKVNQNKMFFYLGNG